MLIKRKNISIIILYVTEILRIYCPQSSNNQNKLTLISVKNPHKFLSIIIPKSVADFCNSLQKEIPFIILNMPKTLQMIQVISLKT